MKLAAAAAFLAAAVSAYNLPPAAHNGTGPAVTTEVVDHYVTYCPAPTVISFGDKTYTITEATTFTITDCPCTITKPVLTTSTVVCNGGCAPTDAPVPTPYHHDNSTATTPAPVPPPNNGPAPPPTQPPSQTAVPAGAEKAIVFSGSALAAVLGLAVFAL